MYRTFLVLLTPQDIVILIIRQCGGKSVLPFYAPNGYIN